MVDINLNVDIPLLTKMWETLDDRFIATWMNPKRMEREGAAQLRLTRAERLQSIELAQIEAGPRVGIASVGSHEPYIDFRLLAEQEQQREYIRKQINLGRSISNAEAEFTSDDPVPDKEVDPDWLYRWKEQAERFSADDMQMLWGKILAGEFKNPGTYNYRTLDALSSLSKADAEVFLLLCSLTLSEPGVCFIFSNGELLKKYGLTHLHMLRLRELGLLSYTDSLYTVPENAFFYFPKHKKAIQYFPKKETKFNICLLTAVGRCLYDLVDIGLNIPYFKEILLSQSKRQKVESIFVSEVELTPDGKNFRWHQESVEKFLPDATDV